MIIRSTHTRCALPITKLGTRSYTSRQLSHVRGSSTPPLLLETIGSVWNKNVIKYSTKELLYNGETDSRFSWKDIDVSCFKSKLTTQERANAFAKGLSSLGFERGDRLGVWMPNTTEWLVSQIACAKIGLVLVNINPAYRTTELQYVLKLVGVKGLVFTPQVKTSNYISLIHELLPGLEKHSSKRRIDFALNDFRSIQSLTSS